MCTHVHIHCLFKAFIIEEYWILSKIYSAPIGVIMWILSLSPFMWYTTFMDLSKLNPVPSECHQLYYSTWFFLYFLEFCLWVLYWEILHLSSSKRFVYNFLFVFVVSCVVLCQGNTVFIKSVVLTMVQCMATHPGVYRQLKLASIGFSVFNEYTELGM